MEVSTEKSKIMTNSMNNTNVDIHMNGQKLRGDDQCRVPGSNPVQGWHLLSRKPHQNCLSNGYNGQTKQDQANMQPTIHHQQT